jgi:hypothetical protein
VPEGPVFFSGTNQKKTIFFKRKVLHSFASTRKTTMSVAAASNATACLREKELLVDIDDGRTVTAKYYLTPSNSLLLDSSTCLAPVLGCSPKNISDIINKHPGMAHGERNVQTHMQVDSFFPPSRRFSLSSFLP